MKRTVWGPTKISALLHVVFGDSDYKDKPKSRGRLVMRLKMREARPKGGYPRYWDRRKRPFNTFRSEAWYEEIRQYWDDVYNNKEIG